MFTLFIVIITLLGYTLFFTKINNERVENNFFLSTAFSIIFLYIFGHLGLLDLGVICFYGLGLILFLSMSIYLNINRSEILNYLTPGMAVSLFFIFLFSFLSRKLSLVSWDEFSHWMPHAKILWANHGFMTATDELVHKSYPPGGRLFYYLFYFISGYSESISYIAHQLLILTAISTITQSIKWKSWTKAFWVYFFTIIIIYLMKVRLAYTGELYMDPLAGIYLGAMLVFYQFSRKNAQTILYMTLPMSAICLFKVDMLPFVLIVSLIIFSDQYICFRANTISKNKFLKINLAIFTAIITSFLLLLWWNYYLKQISVPPESQSVEQLNLGRLQEWFFNHPLQNSFFRQFLKKYISGIFLNGPFLISLCIYISYLFLISKTHNTLARKILKTKYLIFLVGFIGYLGVFYILYQFSFSREEAMRLAAFFRYMNIYYLMVILPTIAMVFFSWENWSQFTFSPSKQIYLLLFIVAIISIDFYNKNSNVYRKHGPPFLARELAKIGDTSLKMIPEDKSIFLIWNDSAANDLPIYIIRNYLLPRKIYSFNLASATINQYSRNELTRQVLKADYLLVISPNKSTRELLNQLPNIKKLKSMSYQLCLPFFDRSCKIVQSQVYLLRVQNKLSS